MLVNEHVRPCIAERGSKRRTVERKFAVRSFETPSSGEHQNMLGRKHEIGVRDSQFPPTFVLSALYRGDGQYPAASHAVLVVEFNFVVMSWWLKTIAKTKIGVNYSGDEFPWEHHRV